MHNEPFSLPCVVTPRYIHHFRVFAVIETDDALPTDEVGHVVEHLPVHLNLLRRYHW